MPKGSRELTDARRKEIIDACEKLYQTMGFKEVTIKEIGNVITFTRTSVYNYFQTKEEIFLALLQREYAAWNQELSRTAEEKEAMTGEELAGLLAETLSRREMMLKLLAMNMYEIEENSRLECLVEFKKEYRRTLELTDRCLRLVRPALGEEERREFQRAFFPFVYGIYPYTAATEKQREAMRQAGLEYVPSTIGDSVRMTVQKLLGSGQAFHQEA